MPAVALPRLGEGVLSEAIETGRDGLPVFKMLVGGRWVDRARGQVFPVDTCINEDVVAYVAKATPADVDRAVRTALESQEKIRGIAGIERVQIFQEAATIIERRLSQFVETLVIEAGKPRRDAEGEVRATIDRLRLTLEEAKAIFGEYVPGDWSEDTAGKVALVIREPVGVVAAISPFNYPLFIAASKIVPALLAGNSVVAKASSENPLSLTLFAAALVEGGLPLGVLNIIHGPGGIGEQIASHPDVDLLSFTGSTSVGRRITEVAGVKRLHLELGGKGMAVVLDDADLELAAKKCVEGALKNAGQRCDAVSAILVQKSVKDRFMDLILKHVKEWKMGDPRREGVKVGPLINRLAAARVNGLVQDAVRKGAKLSGGGKAKACYHEPTVLEDVPLKARIAWEETFGPVVTIIPVSDENQAIEIGKKSRYGLDSCVFSNSFYRIWRVAKRLKTGSVTVNDHPRHGVGYFPFGGSKESGVGREGIGYSVDEMTYLKTIAFNLEPAGLGKAKRKTHI